MMLSSLDTRKIKLASVEYYDSASNKSYIDCLPAFVILYKCGDQYINLFGFDEIPVFERVDDCLVHLCGPLVDGPCYVIENKRLFDNREVSFNNLRKFVLESEMFFIDRGDIIAEMELSSFDKVRFQIVAMNDEKKMRNFKEFFNNCCTGNQFVKK